MNLARAILKPLLFFVIARPFLALVLGVNVRKRERLPQRGPAVIVSNHNSHLDTLVLMSLYSFSQLRFVRPVAADDYWLRNRWISWFAKNVIDIVPIARKASRDSNPLQVLEHALDRNEILIMFPEGTRGEPEQLSTFKAGIAHLAEHRPDVPITPVFMHGLGKALPRGDFLLVPFFCDVFVGESLNWTGNRSQFMDRLHQCFLDLAQEGNFPVWE